MASADRGAAFLDKRVIPADFDWRVYDVQDERHKVRPASDFMAEVIASFAAGDEASIGATWPWDKANDRGLRFRPGEVTIYAGYNGHRKSMLTSQIALHLMRQKQPVLIASLEMLPYKTLKRMVRQSAANADPGDAYMARWHRWSEGRIWLYDHVGNCQPRQITAIARYAVRELGVKHVFIDSLMKVVSATDDYNGQKLFVQGLCSLALAEGVHIHLVCHARKGDGKGGLTKSDVKGAGEITDQADNVCLIAKREEPVEGEPDQFLEVAKQRDGAYEGTLGLFFDGNAVSFGEQSGKKWPGIFLYD